MRREKRDIAEQTVSNGQAQTQEQSASTIVYDDSDTDSSEMSDIMSDISDIKQFMTAQRTHKEILKKILNLSDELTKNSKQMVEVAAMDADKDAASASVEQDTRLGNIVRSLIQSSREQAVKSASRLKKQMQGLIHLGQAIEREAEIMLDKGTEKNVPAKPQPSVALTAKGQAPEK